MCFLKKIWVVERIRNVTAMHKYQERNQQVLDLWFSQLLRQHIIFVYHRSLLDPYIKSLNLSSYVWFCMCSYCHSDILKISRWTLNPDRDVLLPGRSSTVKDATVNYRALICLFMFSQKCTVIKKYRNFRTNFGLGYVYRQRVGLHGRFTWFYSFTWVEHSKINILLNASLLILLVFSSLFLNRCSTVLNIKVFIYLFILI